jgi:hypothetical protein
MWSYTEDELVEEVERIELDNIMLLTLVKLGARTASIVRAGPNGARLEYIKSRYPTLHFYHARGKSEMSFPLVTKDPLTEEQLLEIRKDQRLMGKVLDYPCWRDWTPESIGKHKYSMRFKAVLSEKYSVEPVTIFACVCNTLDQANQFFSMLEKYNNALKSEDSILHPIFEKVTLEISIND